MENNIKWYIEQQVNRVIKSLQKRNMQGVFIEEPKEIIQKLVETIPQGSKVGVGDSLTLDQLGVFDLLNSGNYNYLNKYKNNITSNEKKKIYIDNFSADFFITGSNAVTEEGEIFNIDGNGSRVAPMLYGPKNVIIIIGVNKIVRNIEDAYKRVRQYSAPIDAKRLNKNTPCSITGKCSDCNSKERICNDFVTISGQFVKNRIKVFIINENLGY